MPLLNEQFYPTPPEVVDMMVEPYIFKEDSQYLAGVSKILEPSAGWGHLADRLIERYRVRQSDIACIEVEEEARHILLGKGYKVIDTNFLEYNDFYNFSHIFMNPPFKMSTAHLLKAWKILHKGHIACVLNANTLRNPNSRARRLLLKLIEDHGEVKFIGKPFLKAERPTDVECAIVWLWKKQATTEDDNLFTNLEHEKGVEDADFNANPLATRSMITALVNQYNAAREALIEVDKQQVKFRFYTKSIGLYVDDKEIGMGLPLGKRIDALKAKFWKYTFAKTQIGRQVTSNYQDKFHSYEQANSNLAFTEANIVRILESFLLNQNDIVMQCILEVFDMLTAYHKENRVHVEGWVSNKSWKAATKVVLPNMLDAYTAFTHITYQSGRKLDDLDKALCFLARLKFDEILSVQKATESHIKLMYEGKHGFSDEFESTFFFCRIYKKGTIHLKVKDHDLWDRFNIAAAQGKNWLPEGFTKNKQK